MYAAARLALARSRSSKRPAEASRWRALANLPAGTTVPVATHRHTGLHERRLAAHRRAGAAAHPAYNSRACACRYNILEGEHALWAGVSEPYKHTIRAFLVHFHTLVLRQPLARFSFENGSVGAPPPPPPPPRASIEQRERELIDVLQTTAATVATVPLLPLPPSLMTHSSSTGRCGDACRQLFLRGRAHLLPLPRGRHLPLLARRALARRVRRHPRHQHGGAHHAGRGARERRAPSGPERHQPPAPRQRRRHREQGRCVHAPLARISIGGALWQNLHDLVVVCALAARPNAPHTLQAPRRR